MNLRRSIVTRQFSWLIEFTAKSSILYCLKTKSSVFDSLTIVRACFREYVVLVSRRALWFYKTNQEQINGIFISELELLVSYLGQYAVKW